MASEDTSDYVLNPAQIKALKRAVFSKKYGVDSEDEITLTLCDLHRGECTYEEVILKACLAYLRDYPCKSAKQEAAMRQGMKYFEDVLLDYEDEEEDKVEEAVLDAANGSAADGAQSAAVRSSSSGKLKLETRRSTTPATPPLSGSEENDSILRECEEKAH